MECQSSAKAAHFFKCVLSKRFKERLHPFPSRESSFWQRNHIKLGIFRSKTHKTLTL